MLATIDRAGRVVVPKPLRESLGLEEGAAVEVSELDGRIIMEPKPVSMRLVKEGKGQVIEAEKAMPPLTSEMVRETLEAVRR